MIAQHATWLCGVAESRGHTWAMQVAQRRPELRGRPWPELEPGSRALAIAVRRLADLTPDPRVVERLLVALPRGARRAWEQCE